MKMAANIVFTEAYHKKCIDNVCRICGSRAQTRLQINKKIAPHLCEKFKDNINLYLGVDVSQDN